MCRRCADEQSRTLAQQLPNSDGSLRSNAQHAWNYGAQPAKTILHATIRGGGKKLEKFCFDYSLFL